LEPFYLTRDSRVIYLVGTCILEALLAHYAASSALAPHPSPVEIEPYAVTQVWRWLL
jgi:hypothetical protein